MVRLCQRPGCDQEIAKRVGARFCSGRCQRSVWRSTKQRGSRRRQPATCPRCDAEFLPIVGNGAKVSTQIYCSRQCVNRRRVNPLDSWSGRQRNSCARCAGDRGDSSHPSYCRLCYRTLPHGITATEFRDLLARQGGRCGICREPLTEQSSRIDHDHETGRVRGLLCHRCNLGLGQFGDGPAMLRRALEYLGG